MKLCGFILAAGLGTRIRPLFPNLPKPLLPLNGRPAIAYAMDFLRRAGVSKVIVNVHYMKEQMKEALPALLPPGMELRISEEDTLLGTGGGILHARPDFDAFDRLLVVTSDILVDLSPKRLLDRVFREDPAVHLVLSRSGPLSERGKIGRLSSGAIWLPGMTLPGNGFVPGYFTGIHLIRPSALAGFVESGPLSIIDLYRTLIRQGARVEGSFTTKPWIDLGTEDGYRRGLQAISEKARGGGREEG